MAAPEDTRKSVSPRIERRRLPRQGIDDMDWETKVLSRMERRLESISLDRESGGEGQAKPTWEEASIGTLMNHMKAVRSRSGGDS